MFGIPKDFELRDLKFYVYDFFNRYGFDDGNRILPEEYDIARRAVEKLCEAIGIVNGEWKPVIRSGHNPYYIKFEWVGETNGDYTKGEICDFDEMDERNKRKIEKREAEIFEE
jgi:hypothetical protein